MGREGLLIAAGNARAQALGLTNRRFQEGDASDLRELDDERFDLVVSIFGAMFAPRPFDVAKEMVRVARAGGRIVMGNYPGPPSELVTAFRSYYGPTMNAFEVATANGSQAELETLFNEQNTSDDATSIPATFLRVRVTR